MILEECLSEHCLSPTTTFISIVMETHKATIELGDNGRVWRGRAEYSWGASLLSATVLQTKAVRKRILKSFKLKGHFQKFHKTSAEWKGISEKKVWGLELHKRTCCEKRRTHFTHTFSRCFLEWLRSKYSKILKIPTQTILLTHTCTVYLVTTQSSKRKSHGED